MEFHYLFDVIFTQSFILLSSSVLDADWRGSVYITFIFLRMDILFE